MAKGINFNDIDLSSNDEMFNFGNVNFDDIGGTKSEKIGIKGIFKNLAKSGFKGAYKLGEAFMPDTMSTISSTKMLLSDARDELGGAKDKIVSKIDKMRASNANGNSFAKDIKETLGKKMKEISQGNLFGSDDINFDDFDFGSDSMGDMDDTPQSSKSEKKELESGYMNFKSQFNNTRINKDVLKSNIMSLKASKGQSEVQVAASIAGAEISAATQEKLSNQQMLVAQSNFNVTRMYLDNIAKNLITSNKINGTLLKGFLEYAKKDLTLGLDDNSINKELLQYSSKAHGHLMKTQDGFGNKKVTAGDVFGFGLDSSAWMTRIKQNMKNVFEYSALGQMYSSMNMVNEMGGMGGGSKVGSILGMINPLEILSNMVLGKESKAGFQHLDKMMKNIPAIANNKLLDWSKNKGGAAGLIGDILGIKDFSTGLDVTAKSSQRNLDEIASFDRRTYITINEVLPSILSKINAGVNNSEEIYYDMKSSKWRTQSSLETKYRMAQSQVYTSDFETSEIFNTVIGQSLKNNKTNISKGDMKKGMDDLIKGIIEFGSEFDVSAALDENDTYYFNSITKFMKGDLASKRIIVQTFAKQYNRLPSQQRVMLNSNLIILKSNASKFRNDYAETMVKSGLGHVISNFRDNDPSIGLDGENQDLERRINIIMQKYPDGNVTDKSDLRSIASLKQRIARNESSKFNNSNFGSVDMVNSKSGGLLNGDIGQSFSNPLYKIIEILSAGVKTYNAGPIPKQLQNEYNKNLSFIGKASKSRLDKIAKEKLSYEAESDRVISASEYARQSAKAIYDVDGKWSNSKFGKEFNSHIGKALNSMNDIIMRMSGEESDTDYTQGGDIFGKTRENRNMKIKGVSTFENRREFMRSNIESNGKDNPLYVKPFFPKKSIAYGLIFTTKDDVHKVISLCTKNNVGYGSEPPNGNMNKVSFIYITPKLKKMANQNKEGFENVNYALSSKMMNGNNIPVYENIDLLDRLYISKILDIKDINSVIQKLPDANTDILPITEDDHSLLKTTIKEVEKSKVNVGDGYNTPGFRLNEDITEELVRQTSHLREIEENTKHLSQLPLIVSLMMSMSNGQPVDEKTVKDITGKLKTIRGFGKKTFDTVYDFAGKMATTVKNRMKDGMELGGKLFSTGLDSARSLFDTLFGRDKEDGTKSIFGNIAGSGIDFLKKIPGGVAEFLTNARGGFKEWKNAKLDPMIAKLVQKEGLDGIYKLGEEKLRSICSQIMGLEINAPEIQGMSIEAMQEMILNYYKTNIRSKMKGIRKKGKGLAETLMGSLSGGIKGLIGGLFSETGMGPGGLSLPDIFGGIKNAIGGGNKVQTLTLQNIIAIKKILEQAHGISIDANTISINSGGSAKTDGYNYDGKLKEGSYKDQLQDKAREKENDLKTNLNNKINQICEYLGMSVNLLEENQEIAEENLETNQANLEMAQYEGGGGFNPLDLLPGRDGKTKRRRGKKGKKGSLFSRMKNRIRGGRRGKGGLFKTIGGVVAGAAVTGAGLVAGKFSGVESSVGSSKASNTMSSFVDNAYMASDVADMASTGKDVAKSLSKSAGKAGTHPGLVQKAIKWIKDTSEKVFTKGKVGKKLSQGPVKKFIASLVDLVKKHAMKPKVVGVFAKMTSSGAISATGVGLVLVAAWRITDAVISFFDGYNRAHILWNTDPSKVTTSMKVAAALCSTADSLLFGILGIIGDIVDGTGVGYFMRMVSKLFDGKTKGSDSPDEKEWLKERATLYGCNDPALLDKYEKKFIKLFGMDKLLKFKSKKAYEFWRDKRYKPLKKIEDSIISFYGGKDRCIGPGADEASSKRYKEEFRKKAKELIEREKLSAVVTGGDVDEESHKNSKQSSGMVATNTGNILKSVNVSFNNDASGFTGDVYGGKAYADASGHSDFNPMDLGMSQSTLSQAQKEQYASIKAQQGNKMVVNTGKQIKPLPTIMGTERGRIQLILKNEGGWVNDPLDAGGATNKGITFKDNRAILAKYGINSVNDLRYNLTEDIAIAIYSEKYYKPCGAHQIQDPILATHVFDVAVNSGVTRAKEFHTEAKRHNNPRDYFIERRYKFYRAIVANKPHQIKFLKGWLNRIKHVNDALGYSYTEGSFNPNSTPSPVSNMPIINPYSQDTGTGGRANGSPKDIRESGNITPVNYDLGNKSNNQYGLDGSPPKNSSNKSSSGGGRGSVNDVKGSGNIAELIAKMDAIERMVEEQQMSNDLLRGGFAATNSILGQILLALKEDPKVTDRMLSDEISKGN